MGGFMEEARASAAREFGARHYRAFAFGHYVRRSAPVLGGLAVVAGLVLAAAWVSVHWRSATEWVVAGWNGEVWPAAERWAPQVLWWTVATVLTVLTVAAVVSTVRLLRRRMVYGMYRPSLGWRWRLRRSRW